jgi:hypothetical protein
LPYDLDGAGAKIKAAMADLSFLGVSGTVEVCSDIFIAVMAYRLAVHMYCARMARWGRGQ